MQRYQIKWSERTPLLKFMRILWVTGAVVYITVMMLVAFCPRAQAAGEGEAMRQIAQLAQAAAAQDFRANSPCVFPVPGGGCLGKVGESSLLTVLTVVNGDGRNGALADRVLFQFLANYVDAYEALSEQ